MNALKKAWYHIPHHVRKFIVLIVGSLFIVASALTGWLPGPGGIPLFLIGITILATEFAWAERVRDRVLNYIKNIGRFIRRHPYQGVAGIALLVGIGIFCIYFFFIA